MRIATRLALAAAALIGLASAAHAKVRINVDLDAQTMHVESGGKTFDWKVSSGKKGYETPNGSYKVLWMDKDHFSDTYDQAPMPNAIFFAPGYAIHGAYKSPWGRRASHGCVRIPPAKAAMLFEMVKKQGAVIEVTGGSDASTEVAEKLKRGETGAPTEINPTYAADPTAPIYSDRGGRDEPAYIPPRDDLVEPGSLLYGQVY